MKRIFAMALAGLSMVALPQAAFACCCHPSVQHSNKPVALSAENPPAFYPAVPASNARQAEQRDTRYDWHDKLRENRDR